MVDTKFWKQVGREFVTIGKPYAIIAVILLSEWLLYEYVLYELSKVALIIIFMVGNILLIFFFIAYDEARPKDYGSIPDDG